MKCNKILRVTSVILCLILILVLSCGIAFSIILRSYNSDVNNTVTVDKSISLCSDIVSVISDDNVTTTYQTLYEVRSPVSAVYPITAYGYNGTSKKSVVLNEGDFLTVTSTYINNKYSVSGSISYYLFVDSDGFNLFPVNVQLPLVATASPIDFLELSYSQGRFLTTDDLDYAYSEGYDVGYDEGYDEGYGYGYGVGNIDGYVDGYDVGHGDGYNLGLSEQFVFSPVTTFLTPVHDFLNTNLFGSVSIGSALEIVLFVVVALVFIKMFAGG